VALNELRGWLSWISLGNAGPRQGIGKVFVRFPTHCVGVLSNPFQLDKVQSVRPLAMVINPAVQDPMKLPLSGVVQLDQWWWVYGSVGNLARASGLQQ